MKDTPGPANSLSDAAAMVSRKWRNQPPQPAQEPKVEIGPQPTAVAASVDTRLLAILGAALFVLGAAVGFAGARYWPSEPSTRTECIERAAKEARTDSAMRVLMMVCNRKFPE